MSESRRRKEGRGEGREGRIKREGKRRERERGREGLRRRKIRLRELCGREKRHHHMKVKSSSDETKY